MKTKARRLILVVMVMTLLLVGCGHTTTPTADPDLGPPNATATASTTPHGAKCGYVRWPQKTGTDALASTVNLTPKPTTIATLTALPSPLKPPGKYPPHSVARVAPTETSVYTIHAKLTSYGLEADSDLHLVILDTAGGHMIVEIPNPECASTSPWLNQITAARSTFLTQFPHPPSYPKPQAKTSRSVTVTGVGFFDYIHGQVGVAKNGIELHPILQITFG